MAGALILFCALVVAGVILRLTHRRDESDGGDGDVAAEPEAAGGSHGAFCCGKHLVCEKDFPRPDRSDCYYDDEELDRYAGRGAEDYTDEETEQFRDVLLTLRPEDVAGWASGLDRRGVNMPAVVHDELMMVVSELRAAEDKTGGGI